MARASDISDVDFDVRLVNKADPVFLNNVLKDGWLLYEADAEERIWFQVYATAQWLDFRPVWEGLRELLGA
ncbi:MAG: hypothetical protein ACOZIN_04375 [Myxococcota bacterium]